MSDEIDFEDGESKDKSSTSLAGHFIMAMPDNDCKVFGRSLILIFQHSEKGAMGLIVNRLSDTSCEELIGQLQVEDVGVSPSKIPIYSGGPVETGRGFVLHSDDYKKDNTTEVGEGVYLTATVDIVHDILTDRGPKKFLLILGYSGWSPAQLEGEFLSNGWLHVNIDAEILFQQNNSTKWDRALSKLGVDPALLSGDAGWA